MLLLPAQAEVRVVGEHEANVRGQIVGCFEVQDECSKLGGRAEEELREDARLERVAGAVAGWAVELPLRCRHKVPDGTPAWAHAISCNCGGLSVAKHDEVGATWEEFLECAGAPVVVSGEFAPFGPGDLRRVDSVVTGVPEVPLELGLDYTITGVTNKGGVAAGADRSLGAAMAAESLKVNKFKSDMVAAGLDFLPVAHETTGAMGPAARDRVFLPLIARLKADEGLRQNALARLDIESAPWNARSVRSHFLRRFGVVVARGVGSALVKAKWDGRVLLRARGVPARGHPSFQPTTGPGRSSSVS